METIVLYPSMGPGHLNPIVEFGKLIRRYHPSINVIILRSSLSFDPTPVCAPVPATTTDDPCLTFHTLSPVSPPHDPSSYPSVEALVLETMACNNPNVCSALTSISAVHTILALVIDIFCAPATEVAAELHVPLFLFMSSGACALSLFLHMPTVHTTITHSFKDLDRPLHFPGLPLIDSADMPTPILDRESICYTRLIDDSRRMAKSAGIITNTFYSLEPESLAAITAGLCTPGATTPPHFAVGPLIEEKDFDSDVELVKWLDCQHNGSIVFLCFGSYGLLSTEQVKEVAEGLERSGYGFFWVARGVVMPEGFVERIGQRGLVVGSWVPQIAVLRHPAVGVFVTHCGWNSMLEGVSAGVPMVAWPLYAEQKLNGVVMTKVMKVAVEGGLVTSEEVERGVRRVMESEEGKVLREHVMVMKMEAEAALAEGGSSLSALEELVRVWKQNNMADGIIDNDEAIRNIKRALEQVTNVSSVRIQTTLGNTSVELRRRATVEDTGASSSLVEIMLKAGFRLHTLSLNIDWKETVDEVEEERKSRIYFYKMLEELCE